MIVTVGPLPQKQAGHKVLILRNRHFFLYTCAAGLIEGVYVVQATAQRNFTAEHLVMGLAMVWRGGGAGS
ncbi:MAG: hypothetical protein ING09_00305 [Roseomonas sp.]|nr:hypothetical protein [Roseomonas sp.]MCA3290830.1 hypothetical protein [Roseomonas sp.]MCA3295713.1 hypothetical protein [Roseomonas sp.]